MKQNRLYCNTMNSLNDALAVALERALVGDRTTPLTKEELIGKSRGEVEAAVKAALADPSLLDALTSPELPTQLMLDMAAAGKRDLLLGALQHGAQIDATTPRGETALHLAAKAHSVPCVRLLLVAGADMTIEAPDTGTALHVAAAAGDEPVALQLIDAGDDPLRRDPNGQTAIELMNADHLEAYRMFAHYAETHDARKKAGARLAQYVAGQMPSSSARAKTRASNFPQLPPRLPPSPPPPHLALAPGNLTDSLRASLAADGGEGSSLSLANPQEALRRQIEQLRLGREQEDSDASACYSRRPWTETSHRYAPPALRRLVRMLLLVSARKQEGDRGWLPTELWLKIFRCMDRDWIRDDVPDEPDEPETASAASAASAALSVAPVSAASAPTASVDPPSGGGTAKEGGMEGEGCRLAATELAARRSIAEVRRRLADLDKILEMMAQVTSGDPLGQLSVSGPVRQFEQQRRELRSELDQLTQGDSSV